MTQQLMPLKQSVMKEASIVLSTLNARYIHSAFGLRYLQANLQEMQSASVIREFTLDVKPEDIVENILSMRPKIVGFGVYIWNAVQIQQVVALLKTVEPEVIVVLGGPEVSYETEGQAIIQLVDYVITGWGDKSFADLCRQLLVGERPADKIIHGQQVKLTDLVMPYHLYSDDDLDNRILYVEASRGCPFKCEFCLSALDKTAWPFDLEQFLHEMDKLYQRGARHFKFVDRTFNLKVKNSIRILQFFLDRLDDQLFLHFEVIPDHLPEALKDMIAQFPEGRLQFEIGIQTFNPAIQSLISRRQNNQQAQQNLQWIREQTNAHIHADLIFGLPAETLSSFEDSFNQLYALRPHEIQVGILKRLKGSPIIRHTEVYKLTFNPNPPFNVLSTNEVDYQTMQAMNRFARYWDMIANSGRFRVTLPYLIDTNPFAHFQQISAALFRRTGQTHKISLLRLFDLLHDTAVEDLQQDSSRMVKLLQQDFARSGLKSWPKCLQAVLHTKSKKQTESHYETGKKRRNARQIRH